PLAVHPEASAKTNIAAGVSRGMPILDFICIGGEKPGPLVSRFPKHHTLSLSSFAVIIGSAAWDRHELGHLSDRRKLLLRRSPCSSQSGSRLHSWRAHAGTQNAKQLF